VVDATSVVPEDRAELVAVARSVDALAVAIVLDVAPKIAIERNMGRPDRSFGAGVVLRPHGQLRRGLRSLKREGFSRVHILLDPDAVEIARKPLWSDRRHDPGPFDIIGDVHGCRTELVALLGKLGYTVRGSTEDPEVIPPEGRRVLFLGDLVDRGPDSPGVLRLVMRMLRDGHALCVPGNHEAKLLRHLRGKKVKLTHGLERTAEQLAETSESFRAEVAELIDGLVSHLVLDDGRLVVAHAGMPEASQGRASSRVRRFALYGETTGEIEALLLFGAQMGGRPRLRRRPGARSLLALGREELGDALVPLGDLLAEAVDLLAELGDARVGLRQLLFELTFARAGGGSLCLVPPAPAGEGIMADRRCRSPQARKSRCLSSQPSSPRCLQRDALQEGGERPRVDAHLLGA
jgi:hypothetical protein